MLARTIDDIGNAIENIGRKHCGVEADVVDRLPCDAQSKTRDEMQVDDDAVDLLANSTVVGELSVALPEGPNEPDSAHNKNRAALRRWAVSGAIVLLLHGAVFVALVRWHILVLPATLTRPFLVDLTQQPETPRSQQQSGPQPAPSIEHASQTNSSEQQGMNEALPGLDQTQENPGPRTAGEAATPKEVQPGSTLPEPSAPSENADARSGDAGNAKTSTVGAGEPAVPPGPAMSGPIDIGGPVSGQGVASRSGPRWKKAINAAAAPKPIVIVRRAKDASGRGRDLTASNAPTTNAIGARIQDGAGEAAGRANGMRVASVNATGSAAPASGSVGMNSPAAPATNAIGVTVHFRRGIQTKPIGGRSTLPVVIFGSPAGAAAINGTGIGRAGIGISAIGGSAKTPSGAISGNSFQPRHL
jgi:hypothetical protein